MWDAAGKTLYPGLIDAYGELSADASRAGTKDGAGAGYWNSNVVPQVQAGLLYASDSGTNKKLRSQGITARLVAPSYGIIKGTSVLVSTGDGSGQEVILQDSVALHLKLSPNRGSRGYPNSPMGAFTLVRQAFYDAGWYGQAWEAFQENADLERPERSAALAALGRYLGRKPPVVVDASDELYFLRADAIGDEFNLNVIVRGSGHEYRRVADIKATGRAVIVPLDFAKPPNVATPEAALNVSLERLMHWDLAPENPARLAAAGVKIALTSHGLRDADSFLSAVRKAVKRGLSPEAALTALSVTPAELFGASERLGTLEAGKAANLVMTDGPLFAEKTKVLETWVDGRRYEITAAPQADVRGTWSMEVTRPDGEAETLTVDVTGRPTKLAGKIARGDKSSKLISPTLDELQLTASFKGGPLDFDGIVRLSATVSAPAAATAPAADSAAELTWLGTIVWSDGQKTPCTAKRTAGPKESKDGETEDDDSKEADKQHDNAPDGDASDEKDSDEEPKADDDKGDDVKDDDKDDNPDKPQEPKKAISEVNFPLGAFGRTAPPEQPKFVLFRGATIWTSGPQGQLENADLLLEAGQVKAVGPDLAAPEGAGDRRGRQAHFARYHRLPFAHRHRRGRERIGPDDHGRSADRRFHRPQRH